jgi:hypothetical protein
MTSSTPQQIVPTVPKEYARKWIAWNGQRTRIIASGVTRQQVRQSALATGESRPILDKAPDPNCNFLGGCGQGRNCDTRPINASHRPRIPPV